MQLLKTVLNIYKFQPTRNALMLGVVYQYCSKAQCCEQ